MPSELSQATIGPGASTQSIAPTQTASIGSSNVPGWRISTTALPPSSSAATSSGGGEGDKTVEVGVGAGVGGAAVLAVVFTIFVLRKRRKMRREFARRTKAMREMRSTNFAPDVADRV